MKKVITPLCVKSLLVSIVVLSVISCKDSDATSIRFEPRRDIAFTRAETEISGGANEFSFKLLSQISKGKGNNTFSPLSAHMALSMLCNGAAGETYTEMIENLGYKNLELDVLNSYNQKLLKELHSLDNTSFVSIANGFWANNELPIRESYKSQISNYYQANISNIDSQNMKNHIAEINAWCDEKTKHMIPSLVEPDDDFDALIANALCFEGTWRNGFDKNFTTTDKFYNENGSASNVLMMNRTDTFRVSFDYGLRVIDIPFGNESFSMYVIMSEDDNENIVEVVSSLNNANWTNIKERLRTMKINLSLPKFEIKNTINFKPILTSMGFEKTFSDCPDFSNLCNGMKVSKVFQKNYFKIDENGAKAASVTVSEMNDTGLGTTSPKFKVNRPFIFLIAEKSSSVILFAGIIREM